MIPRMPTPPTFSSHLINAWRAPSDYLLSRVQHIRNLNSHMILDSEYLVELVIEDLPPEVRSYVSGQVADDLTPKRLTLTLKTLAESFYAASVPHPSASKSTQTKSRKVDSSTAMDTSPFDPEAKPQTHACTQARPSTTFASTNTEPARPFTSIATQTLSCSSRVNLGHFVPPGPEHSELQPPKLIIPQLAIPATKLQRANPPSKLLPPEINNVNTFKKPIPLMSIKFHPKEISSFKTRTPEKLKIPACLPPPPLLPNITLPATELHPHLPYYSPQLPTTTYFPSSLSGPFTPFRFNYPDFFLKPGSGFAGGGGCSMYGGTHGYRSSWQRPLLSTTNFYRSSFPAG